MTDNLPKPLTGEARARELASGALTDQNIEVGRWLNNAMEGAEGMRAWMLVRSVVLHAMTVYDSPTDVRHEDFERAAAALRQHYINEQWPVYATKAIEEQTE